MIERHVTEHLAAFVSGNLDPEASQAVSLHIAGCVECRREHEALSGLWDALGRIPEERPAATLEKRFREMVTSFELGLAGAKKRSERGIRLRERFSFGRPAFQASFALCMVAIGFFAGTAVNRNGRDVQELSSLRDEVHGLSGLLTRSLLNQESASERLKGVSMSSRLDRSDPDISAALVYAMNHDRNVNVRLAALDALSREIEDPAVRREIVRAFPGQTSPLMQMALVDMLVQINDRESRDVLQQAMTKPGLLPDVRNRIQQGIRQIL